MTRKSLRKRLRQQPATVPVRTRTGAGWMAVGALAAAAAFSPRPVRAAGITTHASRYELLALGRTPALDRRLAIVDAAFGYSTDKIAKTPAAPGPDDPQQAVARKADIAPGPLSDVIVAFERLTGVRLTLAIPSLGVIQSPGASGVLTPAQALTALLEGTGLRFRFTGTSTAIIDVDVASEAVEVTGRAPGVTIDSPKYPTPLRDTPQTIEVIPRAAMEQQGVTTLTEALRNVPGITLQAGEGGGASNTAGDMFNMRGFNAANSLFVDGVRDDGLVSRDVFNLEQVEVFMGPTGSDVGRGTAAGYVNMQTKAPHLDSAASGIVSYGSANQRRVSADLNQVLSNTHDGGWWSRSAMRANVLWQDSGVPGRDVAAFGTRAIAPSIGLGIETPTRVTASAQIVRQDNQPDYGVPGAAWLDEPLTPTTVLAPSPVDQENYYGSRDYDYDKAEQTSGLVRVEHDLTPRMTLRNQTRYNLTHREAVITSIGNVSAYDPATNLVTLSRQGNERRNSIVSNQTSLMSRFVTGGVAHAASAGLEITGEEQYAPALIGVGTRSPVSIFAPNPDDPVIGYAVTRSGAYTKGRTGTVAFYVFDTVDLGRRWQVNGGARAERYDTRYRAIDATGLLTTNEQAADWLFSGKAGLVFRVNERGSLYVSYGSTVTPPGGANFALNTQPNNQNNPDVKPQESTNLEAGSKWEFAGGRLLLTGAVFHTENRNVIYTIDATAVPPLYNQDDGQRVNGITLGANGRILDRWDVIANISYLDTALESQNAALNGKRLTLTPNFSGGIWTTYRLPLRVTVGGGLRFTDRVFVNSANTIVTPGYQLLDLLAEFAITRQATLRFNVTNATDEVYIRSVNNNGARYNPGAPRSAVATLALRF